MSVEGPCQSSKLPVTSIRTLNKLAKNVSSVSKDDSLTSLDWLSCLGTPQPSVKEPRPAQYTPKELIRLSFRLARHDVLTIQEMVDMAQRLSLKISKSDIESELRRSSEFSESPSGWKLQNSSTGSSHDGGRPAKRAKISDSQENHVNVIVDSSSLKQSQETAKISPLNRNAYCPDLSNVLIDFGIPIMNESVPMEEHTKHGMSQHLPMLEVTGARIPTPEDWIKDEYSNNSVGVDSPQSHEDLFTSSDVDTPFLVDSWLQGMFQNLLCVISIYFSKRAFSNDRSLSNQSLGTNFARGESKYRREQKPRIIFREICTLAKGSAIRKTTVLNIEKDTFFDYSH